MKNSNNSAREGSKDLPKNLKIMWQTLVDIQFSG